jgi:hypothetical protein
MFLLVFVSVSSVQDWNLSLPFKHDLALQNIPLSKQPFETQPTFKMKTSLEVLNIIMPPQEPTSVGHCHYKKWR